MPRGEDRFDRGRRPAARHRRGRPSRRARSLGPLPDPGAFTARNQKGPELLPRLLRQPRAAAVPAPDRMLHGLVRGLRRRCRFLALAKAADRVTDDLGLRPPRAAREALHEAKRSCVETHRRRHCVSPPEASSVLQLPYYRIAPAGRQRARGPRARISSIARRCSVDSRQAARRVSISFLNVSKSTSKARVASTLLARTLVDGSARKRSSVASSAWAKSGAATTRFTTP